MLLESGDLIPVLSNAVEIPWTKRKNQIMNFLHRGSVNFDTMVYDTNVGDISPLSTYFNPQKWTIGDLNEKFGQVCDEDIRSESSLGLTVAPGADIKSATLTPRLVLYPELPSSKLLKESTERSFPTISVWSVPPPILLATPKLSSKLPSPPRKSPDNNFSSGDESCEPIGPPKRRRLSVATNDQPYEVKPFLKPRSASTSSPWTPHFSTDTLSPFLCIEPLHQDVFDNGTSDEDDDLKGVCDEQTLAKSLRKIAKAFQSENVWTAWKTKPFHF